MTKLQLNLIFGLIFLDLERFLHLILLLYYFQKNSQLIFSNSVLSETETIAVFNFNLIHLFDTQVTFL